MGASLGELRTCSKVQRAIREKLAARDAGAAEVIDGTTVRIRRNAQKKGEEETLVKAALDAVNANLEKDQEGRRASMTPVPEISSLGERAHVVVTGRLSSTMELPFQEKGMAMKGLQCLEELIDVHNTGVRCKSGRVPMFPRPNQDDYFYLQTGDSLRVCGVFDGHGADGHVAAAVARDFLLRLLLNDLPSERPKSATTYAGHMHAMFVDAFEKAHRHIVESPNIDANLSGVTACILIKDIKRRRLTVAWTGNCRCGLAERREVEVDQNKEYGDAVFVGRKNMKIKKKAFMKPLTQDHTVERSDERARVMSAGAHFRPSKTGPHEICAPGEHWPGIPVTRCLGNLVAHKYGVIHVPEVTDVGLDETDNEADFAVIATDGIWGVIKDSEALFVLRESYEENLIYGIDQVVARARNRWDQKELKKVVDDMTMLVMRL